MAATRVKYTFAMRLHEKSNSRAFYCLSCKHEHVGRCKVCMHCGKLQRLVPELLEEGLGRYVTILYFVVLTKLPLNSLRTWPSFTLSTRGWWFGKAAATFFMGGLTGIMACHPRCLPR